MSFPGSSKVTAIENEKFYSFPDEVTLAKKIEENRIWDYTDETDQKVKDIAVKFFAKQEMTLKEFEAKFASFQTRKLKKIDRENLNNGLIQALYDILRDIGISFRNRDREKLARSKEITEAKKAIEKLDADALDLLIGSNEVQWQDFDLSFLRKYLNRAIKNSNTDFADLIIESPRFNEFSPHDIEGFFKRAKNYSILLSLIRSKRFACKELSEVRKRVIPNHFSTFLEEKDTLLLQTLAEQHWHLHIDKNLLRQAHELLEEKGMNEVAKLYDIEDLLDPISEDELNAFLPNDKTIRNSLSENDPYLVKHLPPRLLYNYLLKCLRSNPKETIWNLLSKIAKYEKESPGFAMNYIFDAFPSYFTPSKILQIIKEKLQSRIEDDSSSVIDILSYPHILYQWRGEWEELASFCLEKGYILSDQNDNLDEILHILIDFFGNSDKEKTQNFINNHIIDLVEKRFWRTISCLAERRIFSEEQALKVLQKAYSSLTDELLNSLIDLISESELKKLFTKAIRETKVKLLDKITKKVKSLRFDYETANYLYTLSIVKLKIDGPIYLKESSRDIIRRIKTILSNSTFGLGSGFFKALLEAKDLPEVRDIREKWKETLGSESGEMKALNEVLGLTKPEKKSEEVNETDSISEITSNSSIYQFPDKETIVSQFDKKTLFDDRNLGDYGSLVIDDFGDAFAEKAFNEDEIQTEIIPILHTYRIELDLPGLLPALIQELKRIASNNSSDTDESKSKDEASSKEAKEDLEHIISEMTNPANMSCSADSSIVPPAIRNTRGQLEGSERQSATSRPSETSEDESESKVSDTDLSSSESSDLQVTENSIGYTNVPENFPIRAAKKAWKKKEYNTCKQILTKADATGNGLISKSLAKIKEKFFGNTPNHQLWKALNIPEREISTHIEHSDLVDDGQYRSFLDLLKWFGSKDQRDAAFTTLCESGNAQKLAIFANALKWEGFTISDKQRHHKLADASFKNSGRYFFYLLLKNSTITDRKTLKSLVHTWIITYKYTMKGCGFALDNIRDAFRVRTSDISLKDLPSFYRSMGNKFSLNSLVEEWLQKASYSASDIHETILECTHDTNHSKEHILLLEALFANKIVKKKIEERTITHVIEFCRKNAVKNGEKTAWYRFGESLIKEINDLIYSFEDEAALSYDPMLFFVVQKSPSDYYKEIQHLLSGIYLFAGKSLLIPTAAKRRLSLLIPEENSENDETEKENERTPNYHSSSSHSNFPTHQTQSTRPSQSHASSRSVQRIAVNRRLTNSSSQNTSQPISSSSSRNWSRSTSSYETIIQWEYVLEGQIILFKAEANGVIKDYLVSQSVWLSDFKKYFHNRQAIRIDQKFLKR